MRSCHFLSGDSAAPTRSLHLYRVGREVATYHSPAGTFEQYPRIEYVALPADESHLHAIQGAAPDAV